MATFYELKRLLGNVFLADSFDAACKFRILAVIDDCCRENLCLIADTSISGAVAIVARTNRAINGNRLRTGCAGAGLQKAGLHRRNDGIEFTGHTILKWAEKNGVPWRYI